MSVQSILTSVGSAASVNTTGKTTEKKSEEINTTTTSKTTGFDETAVVYEKSKKEENTVTEKNKNNGIDRDAIIAQMKKDQETRLNQLASIVQKMMTQQGNAIGAADDMWKFLAKGDFTVDADTKAQAQADIAEDGYWGVEQTSERILDFAKALSGGDASKADELLEAFKKGFQEATGAWGKELPEISQKTYEAVEAKFAAWKAETQSATTAAENVTTNALQA